MQWSTQYLPLIVAVCFIGVLLGMRGVHFYCRFGYSPFRLANWRNQPGAAVVSGMMAAYLAAVLMIAAMAAMAPQQLSRFDPLYRPPGLAALSAGLFLVLLGAALVLRGQQEMGDAWRVGIDPEEWTRLVTQGLFRFCRNPIYLGLQVALFGFLALVPGALALALVALAMLLFQVQCRLEEAHLLRQHGAAYAEYCRRVGRFLPRTGRRSFAVGEHERGSFP